MGPVGTISSDISLLSAGLKPSRQLPQNSTVELPYKGSAAAAAEMCCTFRLCCAVSKCYAGLINPFSAIGNFRYHIKVNFI